MKYITRLFILALLICVCFLGYKFFIKQKISSQKVSVIHTIEKYNYKLYSNSSELFKENYYNLEKTLKEENFNEEEYASLVAKLFVIDFYTLENKTSNLDIGGIQFVYSKIVDNFKIKAKDTMYKYVKNNIYGDRKQELPEVSSVKINNINVKSLKSNTINDEKAYYIDISWNYKKDLGYETEKKIILIHENEKLSLISID